MSFKVGDYVGGERFKFGVVTDVTLGDVTVSWTGGSEIIYEDDLYLIEDLNPEFDNVNHILRIKDDELYELRKYVKSMGARYGHISAIKDGDVATLRSGEPFIIFIEVKNGENTFSMFNLENNHDLLNDYTEKLIHKTDSSLDIISIGVQYSDFCYEVEDIYRNRDLLTLWERLEMEDVNGEPIIHKIFGEGKIQYEKEGKVYIWFKGYGTKVFSKEILSDYLI